ncbi:MAG: DegV family protein [Candidatus Merdivicinus sp.]
MRDYRIVTDSTSDLAVSVLEKMDVTVIPMEFHLEGVSYHNYPDEREYDMKKFYAQLKSGKSSTTSQINQQNFLEIFEPILQDGKDILYLAFSSGLSGTYHSSCLAAEELRAKYPEAKILCVDTLAASAGEGLFVYTAFCKKQEGYTIEELEKWALENRLHLCHWFTVDDLHHLKRGGRVSPTAAVIGTALGIKPVLHVDNEGHLIPMEKVRGRRRSLDSLVEHMVKTCDPKEGQTIFISHGDALEDAQYVGDQIRSKMKVKNIVYSTIGPVIGSHSGPGTIALFFFGTER